MLVEVIGKPLRYNGRYYHPGSRIDMKPAHANLFVTLRKVKLPTVEIPSQDPVNVPTDRRFDHPPLDEMPKRKYKRRDMQAE